ncbi:unnamed protein product [Musa textilis]
MANGFNPLHHGLPPAGFHPAIPQFPAPPLFGVRPFNMHNVADNFPGPARPFGCLNAFNQPHMQMWDGNHGMFGDKSHIYGRPDWDPNRHQVGSRRWEMDVDMWKQQDGSIDILMKELECSSHALADEAWISQLDNQSCNDQVQVEPFSAENTEVRQSSDIFPTKNTLESSLKLVLKKTLELPKIRGADITNYNANYLSRIDMSLDLVNSELCKKCTSLLGANGINVVCNLSTHKKFQVLKLVYTKGVKYYLSFNHCLSCLLATNAVFIYLVLDQ